MSGAAFTIGGPAAGRADYSSAGRLSVLAVEDSRETAVRMLSLEHHVTSLALAKRLKALGVAQESLYVWSVPVPERAKDEVERKAVERVGIGLYEATAAWTDAFDTYAAFTSVELGALLPAVIEIGGRDRWLRIAKDDGVSTPSVWRVQYEEEGQEVGPTFEAEREADARAQVLIYLLEHHLLALP